MRFLSFVLLTAAFAVGAQAPVRAQSVEIAGLTGDPAKGERIYRRCVGCHKLAEDRNGAGPTLFGVFGRTAGTVEGFRYSKANADSGIVWTPEIMFEYLANPRQFMPGNRMSFPGLRKAQDRVDVIAFMLENGGAQ